jgi:CheY-like chemotaxis protein
MLCPILAILGAPKNISWAEMAFPLVCMLFLAALLWYFTVRVCLDLAGRNWRDKTASEAARREVAENANQVKAEFLANMSHEIRTPLNAIINSTELILKTPLTPELRQYLGTVRTSADWLIYIVNDVLEFSRIEAGTLKLDEALFSLQECITSAVNIIQPEADARNLVLKTKIDPAIPDQLRGDFRRLLQVVFNLLENAVKSTTSGGIMVTVDAVAERVNGITLRFSVLDTGAGMPEDKVKDLFEPLTQKTSAYGLAICRKIVDLMGGSIEVQSRLGAGTAISFTADFQALIEPKPSQLRPLPAAQTAAIACSAARPITIMVADENAISRRLAKTLIEAAGHTVHEAGDGADVLPLFKSEVFDLVLMDLDLAHSDSLKVTRAIRAAESDGSRTPVYALTSFAAPVDRDRCRAAGMDGFIAKPIEIDAVLNIIAAIASRPAHGPSASETPPRQYRKEREREREGSGLSLHPAS